MGSCQNNNVSELQDRLIGGLIGLARAADRSAEIPPSADFCILESLAVLCSAEPNDGYLMELIQRVAEEKRKLSPDCFVCGSPCGRTNDYDMKKFWNVEEGSSSLKTMLLYGIQCMAVYALRAAKIGFTDSEMNSFFYKALFSIGMDDWGTEKILTLLKEAEKINVICRTLWKKASTEFC